MAVFVNTGRVLWATALQTDSVKAAVDYVDFAPGAGTLSSALVSATPYASLSLDGTLGANIAGGATLVITDGVNTDTATVAGGGASAGASSIPLTGYTAGHNFAAHSTTVTPQQSVNDIALYASVGAVRVAANPGAAGAGAGESLLSGYFDGTQPAAVYIQVGYFGGSTASATPGTGTLICEDLEYWNLTAGVVSATPQVDVTLT